MAATIRLATPTRNAIAQTFKSLIDAGGAGEMLFYAGTLPKTADLSPGNSVLLGRLQFALPSAQEVKDGLLNFDSIGEEPAAQASGEASWARVVDGKGRTVFDCDITKDGGGGTIELNTTTIVAGGPIRLRRFSIMVPAG